MGRDAATDSPGGNRGEEDADGVPAGTSEEADRGEASLAFRVSRLRVAAVGDLLMHLPLVQAAAIDSGHDFRPLLESVAPELRWGDITIANLETTLGGARQGFSGYPRFNSPDELVDAARDSGITVLSTANNHALDTGGEGLKRTLAVIRQRGLAAVGTRTEPDQPPYTLVEAAGFQVALLAYTYGTNGIPVPESHLINLIDRDLMADQIALARAQDPDLVLVVLHWGDEYRRLANDSQRDLAVFLHELGVDAVLGAHPHVVQPFQVLEGSGPDGRPHRTPVVYSMGNFVSNQRQRYRDGGIIIHLTFRRLEGPWGSRTELEVVEYIPVWVHRYNHEGRTQFRVMPADPAVAREDALLSAEDRRLLARARNDMQEILGPSPLYSLRDLMPTPALTADTLPAR